MDVEENSHRKKRQRDQMTKQEDRVDSDEEEEVRSNPRQSYFALFCFSLCPLLHLGLYILSSGNPTPRRGFLFRFAAFSEPSHRPMWLI
jgi:hypothetical protein